MVSREAFFNKPKNKSSGHIVLELQIIACLQDRVPAPFSLFRNHLTLHVSIDVNSVLGSRG